MPPGDDRPLLLDVGRITKPHGLRGEVVVDLWTDQVGRLDSGSVLHSDRGDLTVVTSRRHQDRYLVTLAGVHDRPGAEQLRGVVLRAEPLDRPGVLWVHELVGAPVVTTGGRELGTVSAVEANPASDLLVVGHGSGDPALVPLRFVVGRDDDGRVTVDVPDGLVD